MRARTGVGLAALAAGFAVLASLGARADSLTYDEGRSLHYGTLVLEGMRSDLYVGFNTKLPCTAVHALPVVLAARARGEPAIEVVPGPEGLRRVPDWALPYARGASIGLGVLLVLAIGLGARALAGDRAGLAAALLAALEPNLLAHFHYVTSDGPATLATLLLALATRRLARTRRPGDAALAGAALGLALLTKHMLIVLAPIAVTALALHAWRTGRPWPWRAALACALLAGAAALVTVDAGFGFRGVPGRLPERPESRKVALLARVLGRAPLPVPQDFLDGLDVTARDSETAQSYGSLYLLGRLQEGHARVGFPEYYGVVLALKLALPVLVLLAFAWFRSGLPRGEAVVIRTFALGYFLFLSLFNKTQIGVRHALPVVPLLLLDAGVALAALRGPGGRRLAFLLVAWAAASVATYAPDYVAYANELIPDRKLAYKAFADSNLDWGQAEGTLAEWLQREWRARRPVTYAPPGPASGRIVVSVNQLTGVTAPREKFAWLRDHHEPVGHIRHAYLVYVVPPPPRR